MRKYIPAFELKDSVLKKALSFGSIATLGTMQSGDLLTDETEELNGVEEIIVTASKRESKIEDLPMSVQAIAGSRLESANVNDFMDYAELIPSLSYIQYGPGRSAFYIRGTSDGNFGNLAGPNTTVAMYIDESPINTVGLNPDLHIYDMERIEVLNGPQGTLYGSSAQGGTVRLITKKPQLDEKYYQQCNKLKETLDSFMKQQHLEQDEMLCGLIKDLLLIKKMNSYIEDPFTYLNVRENTQGRQLAFDGGTQILDNDLAIAPPLLERSRTTAYTSPGRTLLMREISADVDDHDIDTVPYP